MNMRALVLGRAGWGELWVARTNYRTKMSALTRMLVLCEQKAQMAEGKGSQSGHFLLLDAEQRALEHLRG